MKKAKMDKLMKDLYAASNQNDLASFGIAYRNFMFNKYICNQINFYLIFEFKDPKPKSAAVRGGFIIGRTNYNGPSEIQSTTVDATPGRW
jgi:hypothetical protein